MKYGHARALQAAATLPQQPEGDPHVPDQLGDPLSPYFLADEAARFLRFNTTNLFRKWATRHLVPQLRRGRTVLYERRVLEAFLRGKPWTQGR